VAQRLAQAVKDIEAVCRPLIGERETSAWPPNLELALGGRSAKRMAAGARRGRAA
jgi:hypothetical protein